MDYETLRIIWWVILGIILIAYAIMDGFDLGVSSLLPFIAKNDSERRMMINSIGPFWEGNQTWLIVAGGLIFAAWPYVYGVALSGFYFAFFLILLALILRPVAFKFRSKQASFGWRNLWDKIHFVTGFLPAFITGMAVGNVLLGAPFHFDKFSLSAIYTGNFFGLFRPFAILAGLISLLMLLRHGAIYTALKVEEPVSDRAVKVASYAAYTMVILFLIALVWGYFIDGYVITSNIDYNGYSNPFNKVVAIKQGAWFDNYAKHPWKFIAPILAIFGSIVSVYFAKRDSLMKAFFFSSVSIFGVITSAGLAMFPFILPSITNPNESLTVWDSSSSLKTLNIMLVITCILLPIMIMYSSWVYSKLRGRIMLAMFKEGNFFKGSDKSNK